MPDLVVIDGSIGGGQVLRTAVALSAVSGRPIRVENIRSARPRPGLRAQHLAAVRATAQACGARLDGATIGSQQIEFAPGHAAAGTSARIDVGTAGSLTLVLQCLLPALASAPAESSPTLIGGTDVPFAPPLDYFRHVFLPALAGLGPRVETRLTMRGFYPKGGGEVNVRVAPSPVIAPASWTERGPVGTIKGCAYSLGLPAHIAERMRSAALSRLTAAGHPVVEIQSEIIPTGRSEGCGIVLWAECGGSPPLGASALGRRGVRAERVGEEAAEALLAELAGGGAVDSHLADQLVVWLALANGPSAYTASRVTDHLRATADVTRAVVGAEIAIEDGTPARVRCQPTRAAG